MRTDAIAPAGNVEQLCAALNRYSYTTRLERCRTMGDLIWQCLELVQTH